MNYWSLDARSSLTFLGSDFLQENPYLGSDTRWCKSNTPFQHNDKVLDSKENNSPLKRFGIAKITKTQEQTQGIGILG